MSSHESLNSSMEAIAFVPTACSGINQTIGSTETRHYKFTLGSSTTTKLLPMKTSSSFPVWSTTIQVPSQNHISKTKSTPPYLVLFSMTGRTPGPLPDILCLSFAKNLSRTGLLSSKDMRSFQRCAVIALKKNIGGEKITSSVLKLFSDQSLLGVTHFTSSVFLSMPTDFSLWSSKLSSSVFNPDLADILIPSAVQSIVKLSPPS